MPVTIQGPGQIRSPIDAISNALNVVNQVYGIKANSAALEAAKAKQLQEEEERQRLKSGILSKKEALQYSKDYDFSTTPKDGAMEFQVDDGKGGASPVYMSPKKNPLEDLIKGVALKNANMETTLKGLDTQLKVAELNKKNEATPDQYKAGTFGMRMQQAEQVFEDLSKKGFDPTKTIVGFQRKIPDFAGELKPEALKMQEQAEDNFLNAALRRESGASISPEERASGKRQYFPVAGDSPQVLEQKRQNRQLVINSMLQEGEKATNVIQAPERRIVGERKSDAFSLIPKATAKGKPAPGDTVRHGGKRYKVGADGESLTEIK